ncbi:hypothetical protein J4471_02495 [Candidatus Woesearchaeota archaeon]|nr:hypothetical protein [Candidatus Woesearchaeota archaeon]
MLDYAQYKLSEINSESKDGLTYTFVLLEGPHPNHYLVTSIVKIKESILKRDKKSLESKLELYDKILGEFGVFVSEDYIQSNFSYKFCLIVEQYIVLSKLIEMVENYKIYCSGQN